MPETLCGWSLRVSGMSCLIRSAASGRVRIAGAGGAVRVLCHGPFRWLPGGSSGGRTSPASPAAGAARAPGGAREDPGAPARRDNAEIMAYAEDPVPDRVPFFPLGPDVPRCPRAGSDIRADLVREGPAGPAGHATESVLKQIRDRGTAPQTHFTLECSLTGASRPYWGLTSSL